MTDENAKALSAALARVDELRGQVDELREQVRQLRAALRGTGTLPLRLRSMLTMTYERLLGALFATKGVLTREAAYTALYDDRTPDEYPNGKTLDVLVCKLRQRVRLLGIEIETYWGRGWRLTDESRDAINRMRDEEAPARDAA